MKETSSIHIHMQIYAAMRLTHKEMPLDLDPDIFGFCTLCLGYLYNRRYISMEGGRITQNNLKERDI